MHRCEIDWTKVVWSRGGNNMTLQTVDICTQKDDAKLQDGFKSFPSGHSSSMWLDRIGTLTGMLNQCSILRRALLSLAVPCCEAARLRLEGGGVEVLHCSDPYVGCCSCRRFAYHGCPAPSFRRALRQCYGDTGRLGRIPSILPSSP
jgi:hypothetical protein